MSSPLKSQSAPTQLLSRHCQRRDFREMTAPTAAQLCPTRQLQPPVRTRHHKLQTTGSNFARLYTWQPLAWVLGDKKIPVEFEKTTVNLFSRRNLQFCSPGGQQAEGEVTALTHESSFPPPLRSAIALLVVHSLPHNTSNQLRCSAYFFHWAPVAPLWLKGAKIPQKPQQERENERWQRILEPAIPIQLFNLQLIPTSNNIRRVHPV